MSLVNASVYCTVTKQTILQWRIMNCDVPDITLSQYFRERMLPLLDRPTCELQLQTFDFSCGASTLDLDLPDELSHVHFRDLNCEDPVEKLYYSMGYDPICIYCASEDELETQENFFPICASCKTIKCPILKQWHFMFPFVSILTHCSYHVLFDVFFWLTSDTLYHVLFHVKFIWLTSDTLYLFFWTHCHVYIVYIAVLEGELCYSLPRDMPKATCQAP